MANLLNCSMGQTSLVLDLPEEHELSSCGAVKSPKVIAGHKGKNSIVIPTKVMLRVTYCKALLVQKIL